jgi:hypothetical protein
MDGFVPLGAIKRLACGQSSQQKKNNPIDYGALSFYTYY